MENICGLTTEELQALKEKHGFLIVGTVKQGDNTYHAIFKEPNFSVLESTGKISKANEVKGAKALYNNCVVIADEAIENRDYLKLKSVETLAKHMQSFSVEVKNL